MSEGPACAMVEGGSLITKDSVMTLRIGFGKAPPALSPSLRFAPRDRWQVAHLPPPGEARGRRRSIPYSFHQRP